ncbi:MAG: glycosyltransferase family 2 protein [Ruminococcaceae bacterium]|nr:glycosyltransferase family 2 protein [Oscillospiraceae bacterium]
MKNKPFFTVGIPVYNTEKWVGECIDSILCQGFDNFEIICVDDGSKDKSLCILNSYAAKDARIKVISRANGGPATARNAVLHAADGEYLFFIDSDDTMNTDVLQNAYDTIIKNNNPDMLEVGITVKRFDEIKEYPHSSPAPEILGADISKDERAVLMWLNGKLMPSVCRKFFKNSFITANGLSFDTRYIISEDFDFSLRCYRCLDSVAYGSFSAITYFNPREGSITSNISHKSYYTALCHESELFRDTQFWNLSDATRKRVEQKRIEFIKDKLNYCFEQLKGDITREFALERSAVIAQFITPYIKEVPLPLNRNAILYLMCRIFGITKTVSFMYGYLKSKGVITDE